MKIAMIGHKYIPSRVGGIEIVVDELRRGLVAKGHEVDVYNRYVPWQKDFYPDANPKQKKYEGARLIWVPTFADSSLNAMVYSVLASLRALAGGYDVIHIHAEGPAAMTWLFRMLRIPVVVTIHGLDWQRSKWGKLAKAYLLFGEGCAAKTANSVIVLAKSTQDYFRSRYRRETICISNGISEAVPVGADLITKRWGLEKDGYLLFLARIVPEKGLHYLIEAYGRLNTDKKLVIAGAITPDNRYVEEIVALARQDSRIVMTDFVTCPTVDELYSNCLCYVLPSDVEGMPLSLLEALSYGCRCVASSIPENRETAGDFAAYFAQSDVADLARVLSQELHSRWTEQQRQEQAGAIVERFSWESTVEQTLRVYEEHCKR